MHGLKNSKHLLSHYFCESWRGFCRVVVVKMSSGAAVNEGLTGAGKSTPKLADP